MNAIYIGEFAPPTIEDIINITTILNDNICKTQLDINTISVIPLYNSESKYDYDSRLEMCKAEFININNLEILNIDKEFKSENIFELLKHLKDEKIKSLSNNFYLILSENQLKQIIENNNEELISNYNVILIGNSEFYNIYKLHSYIRYSKIPDINVSINKTNIDKILDFGKCPYPYINKQVFEIMQKTKNILNFS